MAITTPSQVSVTTNQSTTIDPWMQALLRTMAQEGANLYNRGYETYPGPRIAELTPDQQAAFQMVRQNIGNFSPLLDEAAGALRQGQQGLSSLGFNPTNYNPSFNYSAPTSQYSPNAVTAPYLDRLLSMSDRLGGTAFGTEKFGPSQRDFYMSPYQQSVIDRAKQGAMKDWQAQLGDINARAGKAGSFGGSRHAIMESNAREALGEQLIDIETRGLQAALENAQRQFTSDQGQAIEGARLGIQGLSAGLQGIGNAAQLGLQANTATEQARQQAQQLRNQLAPLGLQGAQVGAQLGLQGAELQDRSRQFGSNLQLQGLQALIGSAQPFAGLASTGQQMLTQNAAALEQIGATQQGQNQQNLNLGYADFLRQQGYPQDQLNWLNSIVRGMPYNSTTTTQGTQMVPNPTGQAIGLGIAGLGALGNSGAFGEDGWFSKLWPFKDGGLVPSFADGGLATLLNEEDRSGMDMSDWGIESLRLLVRNDQIPPEVRARAAFLLRQRALAPVAKMSLSGRPNVSMEGVTAPGEEGPNFGQRFRESFKDDARTYGGPWTDPIDLSPRPRTPLAPPADTYMIDAQEPGTAPPTLRAPDQPDDRLLRALGGTPADELIRVPPGRGRPVIGLGDPREPIEAEMLPPGTPRNTVVVDSPFGPGGGIVNTVPGRRAASSPVAPRGVGGAAQLELPGMHPDMGQASPLVPERPGTAWDISAPPSMEDDSRYNTSPVVDVPMGNDYRNLSDFLTAFGVGMASGKSPTLLGMLGEGAATAYQDSRVRRQEARQDRRLDREEARANRKLDIEEQSAKALNDFRIATLEGRNELAEKRLTFQMDKLEQELRRKDLDAAQRERLLLLRLDMQEKIADAKLGAQASATEARIAAQAARSEDTPEMKNIRNTARILGIPEADAYKMRQRDEAQAGARKAYEIAAEGVAGMGGSVEQQVAAGEKAAAAYLKRFGLDAKFGGAAEGAKPDPLGIR